METPVRLALNCAKKFERVVAPASPPMLKEIPYDSLAALRTPNPVVIESPIAIIILTSPGRKSVIEVALCWGNAVQLKPAICAMASAGRSKTSTNTKILVV